MKTKIEMSYFELGFKVSPEMYDVYYPFLKGGTMEGRDLNDETVRIPEPNLDQPENPRDEDDLDEDDLDDEDEDEDDEREEFLDDDDDEEVEPDDLLPIAD